MLGVSVLLTSRKKKKIYFKTWFSLDSVPLNPLK